MKYTEVLHQNLHMQGFSTDGENMYWSFTDSLVKTKKSGLMLRQVLIPAGHLGDIVYYNGKIYGTVLGNSLRGLPFGIWTSFEIHVFDAGTLALDHIIRLDDCYEMYKNKEHGFNGVDGITVVPAADGKEARLMVACALFTGDEYDSQILLEYSFNGKLLDKHFVKTGNTVYGIQNLTRDPDTGNYWFSTYGGGDKSAPYSNRNFLFCVSPDFEVIEGYNLCTPYGLEAIGDGKFYLSVIAGPKNGNREGYAYEADLDFIKSTEISGEYHRKWYIEKWWDKEIGL